jgi:hypothetical protein
MNSFDFNGLHFETAERIDRRTRDAAAERLSREARRPASRPERRGFGPAVSSFAARLLPRALLRTLFQS